MILVIVEFKGPSGILATMVMIIFKALGITTAKKAIKKPINSYKTMR
jgi:hypothetical protein